MRAELEIEEGGGHVAALPTVDWDLAVTKTQFRVLSTNVAGASVLPGACVSNLVLWLMPVDVNNNGLADGWEEQCFGAGTNVAPQADPDGDGQNN